MPCVFLSAFCNTAKVKIMAIAGSRRQLVFAIRVSGHCQSLALLARNLVDGCDARLDLQRVKAWMHRGAAWARAMTGSRL